jgi:hypothetical protein
MKARVLVAACAIVAAACGQKPDRLGVLVDRVPYTRTIVGSAPADAPTRQFVSPSSYQRAVRADVVGDSSPETIVERTDHHGVDVLDGSGAVLSRLSTTDYLTDFAAIAKDDQRLLVLYTYPDSKRGGTFVVSTPEQHEVARWTENVPPARFTTGVWQHTPAVFYLQQDRLTIRSVEGLRLASLDAPYGRMFQTLFVGQTGRDRLAVVASGNGYTPYHMVCVYDGSGQLVFQEVRDEHAFALDSRAGAVSFGITTRSAAWRYSPEASRVQD